MNHLDWLPSISDFKERLGSLSALADGRERTIAARSLANFNLDFLQTQQLAKRMEGISADQARSAGLQQVKLAVLASSTFDHVVPSLLVSALRYGIWLELHLAPYNQYRQEALEPSSALKVFRPQYVLFAIDAAGGRERTDVYADLTSSIKEKLGAAVLFQTMVVPPFPLFGNADPSIEGTDAQFFAHINAWIARQAADKKIHMIDVEALASDVGKKEWCNQRLWLHAKQAISPVYAPLYGDRVARVLSAASGLSKKVLVTDLDNTLWGGVVGDDGVEGIELGQGTGTGEAFVAFQRYLKDLKARGVLLVACSKNEEATAKLPFEKHSETVLSLNDFAAFVANWEDKASNLELIAKKLSLGIDSLVFFDDNPVERDIVRHHLPQVAVPEVPEDPADFVGCLSRAGYFESIAITDEDRQRTAQYRAENEREELKSTARNLDEYLKSLKMILSVAPFDEVGASRITQLINKSNQYNLTTRRYTLEQVRQMQNDKRGATYQFHLKDRFGDNGMISVVIGKPSDENESSDWFIDTWLMSCRVLGRRVEHEVLNCIAQGARQRGFKRLIGEYIPTAKNQMVQDHYEKLGFRRIDAAHGLWALDLASYRPFQTSIDVKVHGL